MKHAEGFTSRLLFAFVFYLLIIERETQRFETQPISMAFTLLNDLRAGRGSNTAEVRLLRLWEARNINKGGELMSLEKVASGTKKQVASKRVITMEDTSKMNGESQEATQPTLINKPFGRKDL
ncbi:hypothetical protein HID58_095717 [Brassica napus]|uniref:Uncharacterized protein n=1 Tax=Brassica napus TaxID=3708 RepID=A0ABQ7X2L7_BRANA|nr:hypothetical protein HID58_095717 [Brassica napus]